MNRRNITGLWYAGSILLIVFFLHGTAFREALTSGMIWADTVVSIGVLVLYFVQSIAIWDSGKVITQSNKPIVGAILPISNILDIRWVIHTLTHHAIFHMRQSSVLSSG